MLLLEGTVRRRKREGALKPDVQWVISPALNPAASSIRLFGIRARIEF